MDTGCCLEDLPEKMDDSDKWEERFGLVSLFNGISTFEGQSHSPRRTVVVLFNP